MRDTGSSDVRPAEWGPRLAVRAAPRRPLAHRGSEQPHVKLQESDKVEFRASFRMPLANGRVQHLD